MRRRGIDSNRYRDPGLLLGIVDQVRLTWRLLTDPRVPVALKAIIPALVVLYAVSPVDLLPDLLFGLGQLDDLGIILAGLALFTRLAPPAVVAEHRAAMQGRAPDADRRRGGRATVIDADYVVGERRGASDR